MRAGAAQQLGSIMTRLDLARQVFEREYARLFAWVADAVDLHSAAIICYTAFTSLMWSGASGRHTSKGAVVGLYGAAEPPLRRAIESRGGYLAAGAYKRALWPRYEEGLELSALYTTWVYVHAAASMGPVERLAIATGLRQYFPDVLALTHDGNTAAATELITQAVRPFVELLDEAAPQDPRAAAIARDVWDRERYRSAQAYRARGSLIGGAAHGEEQQDHNPRDTGSTYRVDLMAGLWRVRDAEPEPGARQPAKPPAH